MIFAGMHLVDALEDRTSCRCSLFCSPGLQIIVFWQGEICKALVQQGLQPTVPCLFSESLMLGMTKIPCKVVLAALESCAKFSPVYVGHFGGQWPCATDGVFAGVFLWPMLVSFVFDLGCRVHNWARGEMGGVRGCNLCSKALCSACGQCYLVRI